MAILTRLFMAYLLFLPLFASSCKKRIDLSSRDSLLKGSAADTVVLKEKAVLFFRVDTLQLQRIQQKTLEMVYDSSARECVSVTNNARLALRANWQDLKEIDNKGARYLMCVRSDKSRICIDMNAPGELCAIYAFDPSKDPQPVDMQSVEQSIRNYFTLK